MLNLPTDKIVPKYQSIIICFIIYYSKYDFNIYNSINIAK